MRRVPDERTADRFRSQRSFRMVAEPGTVIAEGLT